MNEPRRLRDESRDPLERALLNAGVASASSPATRAKTLAALGVGAATMATGTALAGTVVGSQAGSSTGSFVTSSISSVAQFAWTKVAIGLTLLGAVAVPVGYYALNGLPTRTPAGAQARTAQARAGASDAVEASPPGALAAPAPASVGVVAATATTTLGREVQALDAVRATLSVGDAAAALAMLDAYARRHPGGRLAIEAEVLRIDALVQSGRSDVAQRRAEAFLKRYPHSVLAPRVRTQIHN